VQKNTKQPYAKAESPASCPPQPSRPHYGSFGQPRRLITSRRPPGAGGSRTAINSNDGDKKQPPRCQTPVRRPMKRPPNSFFPQVFVPPVKQRERLQSSAGRAGTWDPSGHDTAISGWGPNLAKACNARAGRYASPPY